MPLLTRSERALAQAVSQAAYCNPFLPERIAYEREALGSTFVEERADWNLYGDWTEDPPNVMRILDRAERVVDGVRQRLAGGARAQPPELRLYEDLALFALYHRFRDDFIKAIEGAATAALSQARVGFYPRFAEDAEHLFSIPGADLPTTDDIPHLFACFFQLNRAFEQIFRNVIGISKPVARFRAEVWQSIFTHDMRRYRRVLYDRMHDVTSLITGPSGTGKELAARAIGLARYMPFDPQTQRFTEDFAGSFHAVDLSALSPTLIESELFGHRKGAFTGALVDRSGWFDVCPPQGTVFLDEIGEVGASIQVKLLRVLQTRTFQRIGETKPRRFGGKVIAATHRDLAEDMQAGRVREDFYYRICSDMIVAPSLHERVRDCPDELRTMILFLAQRLVGDEAEALAAETERAIEQHLGAGYTWPGNVRELEQCVRNVLVRGQYQPPPVRPRGDREQLAQAVCGGELTAEELLQAYCALVYAQTGSYQEAARRLGLDRRTVKAKVEARASTQP